MAETIPSILEQELLGIRNLLWGNDIKQDIFKRWSQGFYFSINEQSALEQSEGGPCAILAPVQAFILKNFLLEYKDLSFRDKVTTEIQNQFLLEALSEILGQCSLQKYYVVYLTSDYNNSGSSRKNSSDIISDASAVAAASAGIINGDGCSTSTGNNDANNGDFLLNNHRFNTATTPQSVDPIKFHASLKIRICASLDDVRQYYCDNIDEQVKSQFGVLLFLYSVIATRGLEFVQSELDTLDPLIDSTYGYGSQSLINLLITGRATTYVWDHEQDVGGLKLKGLEKQSKIGFITIMEHLRYCTVGSFYKNPMHPVWVLASDTHLTVLFSDERRLVNAETKSEQARRVFKSFDPDGNNFISAPLLQDVLAALDLVSDHAYVDIMRRKLDSENLGIILLNAFMDEFFPIEETSTPDMFTLMHYNGLAQSNVTAQVHYHIGYAVLLESDLKSICDSNPMLTVLQTKWPNIEVNWHENVTPSLN